MMTTTEYYGIPLPGVNITSYPGKLIAIEGTDSVGRSTQVEQLAHWLETQGFAVAHTGMTRSEWAGQGIKEAKQGHTLGPITMQLFYATDFADRLQNEILPALQAGFIVLTDRYFFSSLARAAVRGIDRDWMRKLYGFAIKPDATFYLRARNVRDLVRRVLTSGKGFDYWESGMDIGFNGDFYDSFIAYQSLLLTEFDKLTEEYGFTVVNASSTPVKISLELQREIAKLVGIPTQQVTSPKLDGFAPVNSVQA